MAQVSLPSVGTDWHTLKLVCNGSRIQVFYDGTAKIDVTDNNFDSRAPYLTGGIAAAMFTDGGVYTMSVDDVVVSSLVPVSNNDSYNTNQNTILAVASPGVLGNDSDPEGTIMTAQLVGGPSHGSLTLNTDGSFTYTPTTNYTGSDSFTYRANNGTLNSNVATVSITIIPVNQPPVANNDSYSTNQDTALVVAVPGVSSNDTDPQGATLTAQLVSGPSHGSLTLNTNGSFSYTPTTGYTGSDSFTYRAINGANNSNVATVTISVLPTLALSSLSLNPTSVKGGTTSQGTVTLNGPAPIGGVLTLLSDNSSAASVPASVTIPVGSTSATFTITTTSVFSSRTVTITALYNGVTKTATLTVTRY
jgi:VCBS repeat-containing protein